MASGNGSPSPLHLPTDVPLIGQPKVAAATITTVMGCSCGGPTITLLSQVLGGQLQSIPAMCAKCQTPYALQGISVDPSGFLQFHVARAQIG